MAAAMQQYCDRLLSATKTIFTKRVFAVDFTFAAPTGIQELQDWLVAAAVQQHADQAAAQAAAAAAARPFLFVVDHCFPLKGQGTILTGTVLQVRRCDSRMHVVDPWPRPRLAFHFGQLCFQGNQQAAAALCVQRCIRARTQQKLCVLISGSMQRQPVVGRR